MAGEGTSPLIQMAGEGTFLHPFIQVVQVQVAGEGTSPLMSFLHPFIQVVYRWQGRALVPLWHSYTHCIQVAGEGTSPLMSFLHPFIQVVYRWQGRALVPYDIPTPIYTGCIQVAGEGLVPYDIPTPIYTGCIQVAGEGTSPLMSFLHPFIQVVYRWQGRALVPLCHSYTHLYRLYTGGRGGH